MKKIVKTIVAGAFAVGLVVAGGTMSSAAPSESRDEHPPIVDTKWPEDKVAEIQRLMDAGYYLEISHDPNDPSTLDYRIKSSEEMIQQAEKANSMGIPVEYQLDPETGEVTDWGVPSEALETAPQEEVGSAVVPMALGFGCYGGLSACWSAWYSTGSARYFFGLGDHWGTWDFRADYFQYAQMGRPCWDNGAGLTCLPIYLSAGNNTTVSTSYHGRLVQIV